MSGCGHSDAEHQAMHESGVWETLRFTFFQPAIRPGEDDFECRDCSGGSTLYRPCRLTEAERVHHRAVNAERKRKFSAELRAALAARGIEMPSGMVA